TEEAQNLWEARLETLPELYRLEHVTLFFALGVQPAELLKRIKRGNETVVVIDTIRNLLGLEDEKDNSEIARVLNPYVIAARTKGQTLICNHHLSKGVAHNGEGITGGHVFLGVLNLVIELHFHADQ